MEIKHIQNDSLGYMVTNHIQRLGHIMGSASLFETMLRFFSLNHKEVRAARALAHPHTRPPTRSPAHALARPRALSVLPAYQLNIGSQSLLTCCLDEYGHYGAV